jgi:CheY-like chemotaxis protein
MPHLHHILLVDDDLDHIRLTRHALRCANPSAEIESVHDGESAIAYLRDRAASRPLPGLVVLDLHLPRMHGLEVLKAIKSDEELKDIPVVVLSSQLNQEDAQLARRLGASAVLCKAAGTEAISGALSGLGAASPALL